MEKPKYFRLYNPKNPVYRTWNVSLLNDEQLAKWEDYKRTEGYTGRNPEEKAMKMKQGDQIKVEAWAQQVRLGVVPVDENGENIESEMKSIHQQNGAVMKVPVYKFVLPKGYTILNERQFENFKMFIEKEIEQVLKLGQSTRDVDFEGYMRFTVVAKPEEDAKEEVKEEVKEPVKAKK